jgi:hypothetical protein
MKNIVYKETKMTIIGSATNKATKFSGKMLTRAAVTGGMAMAYSTFVLGNGLTQATILNSAGLAGACIASEFITRQILPMAHLTNSKSGLNIGIESAIAGSLYAGVIYPRLFPGSSVGFMGLLQTGAAIDVASQLVNERVYDILTNDPDGAY